MSGKVLKEVSPACYRSASVRLEFSNVRGKDGGDLGHAQGQGRTPGLTVRTPSTRVIFQACAHRAARIDRTGRLRHQIFYRVRTCLA